MCLICSDIYIRFYLPNGSAITQIHIQIQKAVGTVSKIPGSWVENLYTHILTHIHSSNQWNALSNALSQHVGLVTMWLWLIWIIIIIGM